MCPRSPVRHRDYVLAAAAVGAHGFMEKPLAVDPAEADEMAAAVAAKGLKWSIAFNWGLVAEVRHALKLVGEGLIGDVMEIRARGKEDHRSGGEDLVVLGPHLFDLMRRFAGDPRWCQATALADGKPASRSDIREATEPLGPVVGDTIQAVSDSTRGSPAPSPACATTGRAATASASTCTARRGSSPSAWSASPMCPTSGCCEAPCG